MKEQDWKALAVIAAFYAALEWLGVTCPIRFLTGVSCPGCGMSRAWLSLLRLDFLDAWRFHPLFWLPVPAAALLLNRRRLPRRLFRFGAGAVLVLFAAVYAIRLMTPGDEIAVFRPRDGFFLRLLAAVLRGE